MILADALAVPAPTSAPLLLGATLTGRGVTLRITEVEAYHGPTDPGSHGHRGPTPRNRHLFGPPGTLYAYRSYGIHTCVNVVSGPEGTSSGALIRAGAVVEGLPLARRRRGPTVSDVALARGPGNVGVAIGAVLGEDDGTSVIDGRGPYVLALAPGLEARLTAATPVPPPAVQPKLPAGRQGSRRRARAGSPTSAGPTGLPHGAVSAVVDELLGELLPDGTTRVGTGPRTGIRGVAGGAAFPWRFWLRGDATVSSYRRHPKAEG